MPIKHQLTTFVWLGLPIETRQKLKGIFKIKSTGNRSFQQFGGVGTVTSDGHTHADLAVVTLEAMASYLGKPVSGDFWKTFDEVLAKVEQGELVAEHQEGLDKAASSILEQGFKTEHTPTVDDSAPIEIIVPPAATEKPLDRMNRAELVEKAKSLNIEVTGDATKAQLVAAIQESITNSNPQ